MHRFFHGEFWMTVGSNPHLHTDDRVRRTLCRRHVLLILSAVTMTITVLENYKLCGGTSQLTYLKVINFAEEHHSLRDKNSYLNSDIVGFRLLSYSGGRAIIKHSLRMY